MWMLTCKQINYTKDSLKKSAQPDIGVPAAWIRRLIKYLDSAGYLHESKQLLFLYMGSINQVCIYVASRAEEGLCHRH